MTTVTTPAGTNRRLASDLVVCSLEAWDEVWRRNQFLVDGLLHRNPGLQALFVEPPHDLLRGSGRGQRPAGGRLRTVGASGRLWAMRPLKLLPRRAGPWTDRSLRAQVARTARRLGLSRPVLWINDVTYGPLIARTGWPSLYDVTDDWLLASAPPRELARLRRLEALTLWAADEVVVCSPALAGTRGAKRRVTLIPNGVDVEHFTRRQAPPADLPRSPVAVYVGTLHDERIDVDLVVELACVRPELQIAMVGPDALSARSRNRLLACPTVTLLGPRAYVSVPGYLQHADVIIVPHLVTPFTGSLDPIKSYECLAVGRPTVATEVAGFRDHGDAVVAVPRGDFVNCVARRLDDRPGPARQPLASAGDHDWEARCAAFEETLLRLA